MSLVLPHSCDAGSEDLGYSPPTKRSFIDDGATSSHDQISLMNALPDECLCEIFRRLESGRERCASACVSRRWLMLLSSIRSSEFIEGNDTDPQKSVAIIAENAGIELDRCIVARETTDIVKLAAAAVAVSSLGGLRKLWILGSDPPVENIVSNYGLSVIARSSPSLKILTLWSLPYVDDQALFEIARECQSVEDLQLHECPLISEAGLAAIAKGCTKLHDLRLESCFNIGDEGVLCFIPATSTELIKVKLENLNITDASVAAIGLHGKAITRLVLSHLSDISEEGFKTLGMGGGLHMLSHLILASCGGVTDSSLEVIGKGCPNLKQTTLQKCSCVSNDGIVAFAKATAGSLTALQLTKCHRITLMGIIMAISIPNSKLSALTITDCSEIIDPSEDLPLDLFSPSKSMRCMRVRICEGFGNSSLMIMAKMCPHLTHFELHGLHGIDDVGIITFAVDLKAGFKMVNLSTCSNVTDKAVICLATFHGYTIETFILDSCRRVTDSGLEAIANCCPYLSILDVSNSGVTDVGMNMLACGVQIHLGVLSVMGCVGVTDRSMMAFKKLGREGLQGLFLKHCNFVNQEAVEDLKKNVWCCEVVAN